MKTEATPETTQNERKASPFSGCLIFIILIAVFTCLGGFIIWHYTDTQKAVHAISEEQAKPVATAKLVPEHLEELTNKFKSFANRVTEEDQDKKEVASITLTVDEINLAIAQFQKMEEFRGKMYITKITSDGIEADICFPVKAGITQSSNRHLNGTMLMLPSIEQGSLFPTITEISPSTGSEVPEKLVRFLPQGLFSSYRTDPDLQSVFHKLTKVELKDNVIIVTSDPKELNPKRIPTLAEGKDNLFTALAIIGILFFVFFTTTCMIIWLRKRSKQMKAENLAKNEISVEELEQEKQEHHKAQEDDQS